MMPSPASKGVARSQRRDSNLCHRRAPKDECFRIIMTRRGQEPPRYLKHVIGFDKKPFNYYMLWVVRAPVNVLYQSLARALFLNDG